ncbi:MAG: FAD-dependent oxidoreductase [Clostridiales Family XIII bacterium]|nr:FAD-dependent oxidoreductase [Clostridiales Family XIII bacterium]
MDFQDIKFYASDCFHGNPPPCSSACPFGIDVRDLIGKVQKGRYGSAFRAYRDAVIFPDIISRLCPSHCGDFCVRGRLSDGAVDLRRIERGIVANAGRSRDPVKYASRQKTERVAVVGGGLSGLACAFRLASKGYRLTLYESSAKIGGRAGRMLPGGIAEAEIAQVFLHTAYEAKLGETVEDVAPLLAGGGTVYIATGENGNHFGLAEKRDERTLATRMPGVYLGGSLFGCDPAQSVENGLRAASAIEEYLKTGRNDGVGPLFAVRKADERFYALPYAFDAAGEPAPTAGAAPAETLPEAEECQAEAARCPLCDCTVCMDACELMRHFNQNPKRIAADLGLTVLPVDDKIKRVASRMLNSCSLCGLCTAVCPAGVDTCTAMFESRRILSRAGHLPAAYHDFWMADMAFSLSADAYALLAPADAESPLLFFPGCQLAASSPETVEHTYAYLRNAVPGASLLLSCCGVPADWAAEEAVLAETTRRLRAEWEKLGQPEFLFACSTCKKSFAKYLPEVRGRLVYEWLSENGGGIPCPAPAMKLPAIIYDPCSSTGDVKGRTAVRRIAEKSGFVLENPDSLEEPAACCGFGGHIYPANPGLAAAIAAKRTGGQDNVLLTYCANCRDLFLHEGRSSLHVLDLLFPPKEAYALPDLTARRENRRNLKKKLTGSAPKQKIPAIRLEITRRLTEKMNACLLLREDAEAAVAHCEESHARIFDPATGHFFGYGKRRVFTVWVEYEMKDPRLAVLHNIYSHRMEIQA